MRKIRFLTLLIVLLGACTALYWYTTKSTRDAAKEAEKAVEQELMHEEAPADTAVVDTLGAAID